MDTPFSLTLSSERLRTKLPNMNLLSVPPSLVRAMGGSPVGTKKVKLDANPTPPDGRVRIHLNPLATLAKICQPGKTLEGVAHPMVGTGEVHLTAVPEAPRTLISTNDNYCVKDPVLTTRSLNVVLTETQNSNVNCSVASLVYFATNSVRQTQKKGLSPPLNQVRNKVCELCFFCRSLCFCPNCSQCPQCCSCSTSRRTPPALLADLGFPGGKSESGVNPKRGLCAPVQTQIPSSETPPGSQWLCQSPQKPLPKGGGSKPIGQKGEGSSISSLFQQTFHSSQTKSEMAASLRPQCTKQIFERKNIQNGNPRDNSDFLTTRGMGVIAGFQRRLFPHSNSHRSRKYLRFHFQNQSYQFRALPFGLSTAPMVFTCVVNEVKLMAQSRGIMIHQYLDDWLIQAPTKNPATRAPNPSSPFVRSWVGW